MKERKKFIAAVCVEIFFHEDTEFWKTIAKKKFDQND